MIKTYYALLLDDPGKPGFVSAGKPYIGAEEEMTVAAGLMRCREPYGDTVAAIDDYFCGNKNATHNVAYRTEPVFTKAEWVSEAKMQLPEMTWEHTNTWGCVYKMKCNRGLVMQIIVKYEGKYCRCLRVWFDNLCYEGPVGSWNRVTSFWGHRDLMLIYHLPGGGLKVNNVLYLIDKQYDTLEEAVDSLLKPEELSFASFCDEIFSDG